MIRRPMDCLFHREGKKDAGLQPHLRTRPLLSLTPFNQRVFSSQRTISCILSIDIVQYICKRSTTIVLNQFEQSEYCSARPQKASTSPSRSGGWHTMEAFSYTPLDASKDEIRLLRINPRYPQTNTRSALLSFLGRLQTNIWSSISSPPVACTLETISLKNCPNYFALSYAWEDLKSIVINDLKVTITINLEIAYINSKMRPTKLSFDLMLFALIRMTRMRRQSKSQRWKKFIKRRSMCWMACAIGRW